MALVCRLGLALPALGDPLRFYVAPDSFEYDQLATNLVEGHGYSQALSPPYLPDVRRTPGFPALLTATYALAGHQPAVAVAVNAVLGVLACALTARLGGRAFGKGAGLVAGLLLAVDLTSAAYSLTLMSETLFAVLLLLCTLRVLDYLRDGSGWHVAMAGIWCGLSILTRPIGLFLPVIVGPALWWLRRASAWPARLLGALGFTALALAFPAAWTSRNYLEAGVPELTSLVAVNAYYQRAALLEAQHARVPVEAVRRQLAEQAPAENGPAPKGEQPADLAAMEAKSVQIVASDPAGYLALNLTGVGRLLAPDRDIVAQLRAHNPNPSGPPASLAEFVTASSPQHTESGGTLLVLGWLQLLVVYALAITGLIWGLRATPERRTIVLLALVSLYFLAVSGPEAYARFRVPMMPFVSLLGAVGARVVWSLVDSGLTWLPQRVAGNRRQL